MKPRPPLITSSNNNSSRHCIRFLKAPLHTLSHLLLTITLRPGHSFESDFREHGWATCLRAPGQRGALQPLAGHLQRPRAAHPGSARLLDLEQEHKYSKEMGISR